MIFDVDNFIRNMRVFNIKNKILWRVIKRIVFKQKIYLTSMTNLLLEERKMQINLCKEYT